MSVGQNYLGSELFERAKNASLNDFIQQMLSAQPKSRGKRLTRYAVCPSAECRANDNPHSERLMVADDRYFRCFRCGASGSIIDAAMLIWAIATPKVAAHVLLGESAMPLRRVTEMDPQAIAADKAKEHALHLALPRILAAAQDCASDRGCLRYLCEERGIPLQVVREAQKRQLLGCLPSKRSDASAVLRKAVGDDTLIAAGFWDPQKYADPWIARRPLVFFFPNLTAAEFRLARAPKGDEKKSLQRGSTDYPWFWSGSDRSRALVVEGFIDLLSVVAMDYPGHVLGSPGCNNWRPEWFDRLPAIGVTQIDIGFDNDVEATDNPGHKWADILSEHLRELGLTYQYAMPKRGDMNELLRTRIAANQRKVA